MPEAATRSSQKQTTSAAAVNEDVMATRVEELTGKKTLPEMVIQPKLTVGAPNDAYEQEADSVADQVMRMPEQSFVQRKCADCEEEVIKRKPLNQTNAPYGGTKGSGNAVVNKQIANLIQRSQNTGTSLDSHTQSFMSNRFGNSFDRVKIHTDDNAVQLNRSLNAKAFTVGSDIYFNEGQYAPEGDAGKHLLAHELTHTMQQGGTGNDSSQVVQRAPAPATAGTMPATTTVSAQPSEADVRAMVNDAIQFLQGSIDFYLLAVVDSARLERTLSGWITMANTYPDLIATRLNNDAALLKSFQEAFNNAVRVLFTRYASVPANNTSVINLYLSNLHRLPDWARPSLASFKFTTEAQQRTFVTEYTNALNNAALYAGFSAMTTAQLESVLGYLFTLTTDTQDMIAAKLSNDAALLAALRTAYSTTIRNLLSRALLSMPGETVFSLFMRFRYQRSNLIHEWADQQLAGFTVAVPLGTSPDPLTGEVTFTFNGYNVTIRRDGTQSDEGAITHGNFANPGVPYRFNRGDNRITSFTPPPASPSISIWTDYGPGLDPGVSSAYGRGTTAEDTRLGNTTLGYHERSHSRDFLSFLANTAPPVFAGTVGMTVTEFEAALSAYRNALARMARASELATDCVGTPNIVQYHARNGTTTTVVCP